MDKKFLIRLLLLPFLAGLIIFSVAQAALAAQDPGGSQTPISNPGGSQTPPASNMATKPVELTNPLGNNINSPQKLIGQLINALLGLVGSLALVMFIYGGFTWMMAAGNESAVEKGRNILMWSTIGLVVIFSSYALVKFVISSIGAATK